MIKLTFAHDGSPVWVRAAHISAIYVNAGKTTISVMGLSSDDFIRVQEPIEDVLVLMQEKGIV